MTDIEPTHLDGNAAAGALSAVFSAEATAALGWCGSCGGAARLAETRVYAGGPGLVMRCPHCGEMLLSLVSDEREPETPRWWLNVDGLRMLHFGAPMTGSRSAREDPGGIPQSPQ